MDEFLTSASPRLDKKNLTSSHLGACFFVFSFRIKVLEYVAPVSASEEWHLMAKGKYLGFGGIQA